MNRLIALIITLILVPQFAFASQVNSLRAILDEYTYSMTVEWDQQDKEFSHQKSLEMESRLKKLVQAGLTKEDIREAFKDLNPTTVETELMLVDTSDPRAVSEFLLRKRNEAYAQGSAWFGQKKIQVIGLGLIIMAAALMILIDYNRHYHPDEVPPQVCQEYTTQCHYYCDYKYDYYTGEVVSQECWEVCEDVCL